MEETRRILDYRSPEPIDRAEARRYAIKLTLVLALLHLFPVAVAVIARIDGKMSQDDYSPVAFLILGWCAFCGLVLGVSSLLIRKARYRLASIIMTVVLGISSMLVASWLVLVSWQMIKYGLADEATPFFFVFGAFGVVFITFAGYTLLRIRRLIVVEKIVAE